MINATLTLTINPAAASKVVFTSAPITTTINVCSAAAATVQLQDQFNNPVNAAADTTVALVDDSTNFNFHLAAGCGDAATGTATIAAGTSSSPARQRWG